MAGPNPAQQSPTILQRLARMKKLRNLQLALDLMGSQPNIPQTQELGPTAQEYKMQEEHADLLEEDGAGGAGGGGGFQFAEPANLNASADAVHLDKLNNAYALRAARTATIGNLPISPTPAETTQQASAEEATREDPAGKAAREVDPMTDPAYRLKQDMREARQEAAQKEQQSEASQQEQVLSGAVSSYTDAAWLTWMWASIPAILVDFGFSFTLATFASWIAAFKTVQGPLVERMIGKSRAAALPPAFGFVPGFGISGMNLSGLKGMFKITSGINSFCFFVSAHLIWIMLTLIIALAVIQVYLLAAPYIEAASAVCRYITIHPLCLIAPK